MQGGATGDAECGWRGGAGAAAAGGRTSIMGLLPLAEDPLPRHMAAGEEVEEQRPKLGFVCQGARRHAAPEVKSVWIGRSTTFTL